jgi:hypothetical protein
VFDEGSWREIGDVSCPKDVISRSVPLVEVLIVGIATVSGLGIEGSEGATVERAVCETFKSYWQPCELE